MWVGGTVIEVSYNRLELLSVMESGREGNSGRIFEAILKS